MAAPIIAAGDVKHYQKTEYEEAIAGIPLVKLYKLRFRNVSERKQRTLGQRTKDISAHQMHGQFGWCQQLFRN